MGIAEGSCVWSSKRHCASAGPRLLSAADCTDGDQGRERLAWNGLESAGAVPWSSTQGHNLALLVAITFHVDKLLSLNYPQSDTNCTRVRCEIHYCLSHTWPLEGAWFLH